MRSGGRDADELPRVAEWEEGERLANEKEVLGILCLRASAG
jgi:hypothetical protein